MNCRRRPGYLSLLLAILPPAARAEPLNAHDVGQIIERGFDRFKEPGLAAVVIQDGKVVWLGGLGVRKVGAPDRVDADTVFAIGSCSKSFASALAAKLVDEGKIDWDDKVQKHLPWFKLYSPAVTEMVSLRDLLGMRTGLASSEYSFRRASESRLQQVQRMRYLKPATEFRDAYIYSTDNYTALGLIEAVVAGQAWEDLAQQDLWGPLGMTRTNASYLKTEQNGDFASPHIRRDGRSVPLDLFYEDYSGVPAGGVNASARDLGKWLQFQLDDGAVDGKPLISAASLDETHRPQMIVRGKYGKDWLRDVIGGADTGVSNESYAMGWESAEYRGVKILSHDGAIDGFRCAMTLIPSEKLGIGLLTNADEGFINDGISRQIVDASLSVTGRDWIDTFARYQEKVAHEQTPSAGAPKRQADLPPTHPLSSFAGSYLDVASGYGAATVSLAAGKLSMTAGRMTYGFEPWAGDVFRVTENSPSGDNGGHPFFAKFDSDISGEVDAIETTTGARFERRPAAVPGTVAQVP